MKLLSFTLPSDEENAFTGVLFEDEQQVLNLSAYIHALGPDEANYPLTLQNLVVTGQHRIQHLQDVIDRYQHTERDPSFLHHLAEIHIEPCLTSAGKIICVGLNYRQHAIEAGFNIPQVPILFAKYSNALCGIAAEIPIPYDVTEMDYEVELGVVIGVGGRHISVDDALQHVFGYCTVNDVSARDLQFRTNQWLIGKTPDRFLPHGPYLVTADEIKDPQNLQLRTWVNDELRQDANTADMIFSVADIISYISRYITLMPGDLICTGTPSGVAQGMSPPRWLTAGDTVTAEVEQLGQLTNTIIRDNRTG